MSDGPPLDVLIVDDEPLGRLAVRDLLRRENGIGTIREANGGPAAVRMLGEERADVVFLDVHMPRLDGFGVIETVGATKMPAVIFVTAYDQHAVRAFEVHAIDYLLKPIDPDRFHDALERGRRAVANDGVTALRATLAAALPLLLSNRTTAVATAPAEPATTRLTIRHEGRIYVMEPREIDWAESAGNYVNIHARRTTFRHRVTLNELAAILGDGFVRISRSQLVRATAVQFAEPISRGSYTIVLKDQTSLRSSRYFRDQLAPLLGE